MGIVMVVPSSEVVTTEMRRLATEAQRALAQGADQARTWLATPSGRQFRSVAARVLLVATPLVFRSRFFRYTWPGRIIELAGGAALLIKLAEIIRDWEPDEYPQVVETTGTRHPA